MVLMDWKFAGEFGARSYPSYVYIIMRTILDEEGDVIEGLKAGADECVSKQISMRQLIARLQTARRILSLEHALKHKASERRKMAMTDSLTGAFNRRYLMKHAQRDLRKAQLSRGQFSLLALDIDHFKAINDRHGHDVGDAVLVEFVSRLRACVKRQDWCARMGGEEFTVVLQRADLQRARRVAERIRAAIAAIPFRVGGRDIAVTVSIGISSLACCEYPEQVGVESLLHQADKCLYRSKRTGRNKVSAASRTVSSDPDAQERRTGAAIMGTPPYRPRK